MSAFSFSGGSGKSCRRRSIPQRPRRHFVGIAESGACKVTDKGRACQEFYDWAVGGRSVETNASITWQRAKEKIEELGSDFILSAISFANGANSDPSFRNAIENETTPSSIPDNKACPGSSRSWTFGLAGEVGVIGGVGGEAGAAFRCDDHQAGQQDMKWYSGGSWSLGAAAGTGAAVGFWNEPYNNIRGESHGLAVGILDIANLSPKVKIPTGKIKGVPISPDLSIGVWFAVKDDGGVGDYKGFTINFGAAAGASFVKYIKGTTVQWRDYEMDCALHTWRQIHESGARKGDFKNGGVTIVVHDRDKDGITVDITKGGVTRTNLEFDRDTITDKRDYEFVIDGETVERICFRHKFRELKYRDENRNCDKGISLKVDSSAAAARETSETRSVVRSVSAAISTLGLWDFDANGRTLTDEFIEQTDAGIVFRRYGTTQSRRYENVGENEYRNAHGSTFRFVSDTRGIWISPDRQTVYQMRKR